MYRAIVIRPDVNLPPLSTEVGPRPYAFLAFLNEWVLQVPGMRKDENLPHLFEWEEAIDAFGKKLDERFPPPEGETPEAAEVRVSKMAAACVGEKLYVTDAAFLAAKQAAKDALDAALTPDPTGRQRIAAAWGLRVLRHYHAYTLSRALEAADIPGKVP